MLCDCESKCSLGNTAPFAYLQIAENSNVSELAKENTGTANTASLLPEINSRISRQDSIDNVRSPEKRESLWGGMNVDYLDFLVFTILR